MDETIDSKVYQKLSVLFLIVGVFIPSLCYTTHMKVFPCTTFSGKTHHLVRPQGNDFGEVFTLFIFIRIWLIFVLTLTLFTVSNIIGKCVGHSWKLSEWKWLCNAVSNYSGNVG